MSMAFDHRDYARFDELAEEFAERFRRGERPSIEDYVDRFPEMANEIREMFPALVEVERAEVDLRGETSQPAAQTTLRFHQIGDYRILREIGRGGMGVVYEAEQVSLGRRVALKVLPANILSDRITKERFLREAKSAARLHHTNIVPVYEVGREGDVSFYAMQLIQGQGIDQVIDELKRLRQPKLTSAGHEAVEVKRLEISDALDRTRADASALLRRRDLGWAADSLLSGRFVDAAQNETSGAALAISDVPVTERFDNASRLAPTARVGDPSLLVLPPGDLSSSAVLPGGKLVSNIDTSGRRQPFFRSVAQIGRQAAQGLAHAHARGVVHRDIKPSNLLLDTAGVVWITDFGLAKAEDDGLTATGDIMGTVRYMAPERFRGLGDARADTYGLGLTLYELLTLRPAYGASDRLNLVEQIKSAEPVRPRGIDAQIPRDLETIILKSIDKDPDRRYASAEMMSDDLRRFLADEPIRARRASTPERYLRWARRNPGVAVLGALLTAVLVLVTVGSLLAASRFADLAHRQGNSAAAERSARLEADHALRAEENARASAQAEARRALLNERIALEEKQRADATLADMYTSRGLLAGERDAPAEAALWFASAARQAAAAEDSRRQENNRLRMSNWMRRAITPVAALTLNVGLYQFEFQPGGKLLLARFHPGSLVLWSWRDGSRRMG